MMKEKMCYVAEDYEMELKKSSEGTELEESYTLPNGNICKYSSKIFQCPELLFLPKMDGREIKGIHKLTFDSIMTCDLVVRKDP